MADDGEPGTDPNKKVLEMVQPLCSFVGLSMTKCRALMISLSLYVTPLKDTEGERSLNHGHHGPSGNFNAMAQIRFILRTHESPAFIHDSWMHFLWAPRPCNQSKENPQETLKTFISEQHWRNDDDVDEWPVVRRGAMRYSEQDEAEKAMAGRRVYHG